MFLYDLPLTDTGITPEILKHTLPRRCHGHLPADYEAPTLPQRCRGSPQHDMTLPLHLHLRTCYIACRIISTFIRLFGSSLPLIDTVGSHSGAVYGSNTSLARSPIYTIIFVAPLGGFLRTAKGSHGLYFSMMGEGRIQIKLHNPVDWSIREGLYKYKLYMRYQYDFNFFVIWHVKSRKSEVKKRRMERTTLV